MSNSSIAAIHKERFGIDIKPETVKYWYNKWQIKKNQKNKTN
ncbi:MAG: hypothetical protein ACFFCY_06250 [Promethearchaeota archaeon]